MLIGFPQRNFSVRMATYLKYWRIPALAVLIALASAVCHAQTNPPRVEYDIHVTLEPESKTLAGFQTLRYTNMSQEPIADLQFHLYLNAFKNERSTFYLEMGGAPDWVGEDDWGYIDVERITLHGVDQLLKLRYIRPDDGNPDDETVARLPLDTPLEPGQTIELDIKFSAKLPRVVSRTGYRGDYFMVGQWFPKLGVWESAGVRGRAEAGWNCHQFHANSEFYADFGAYHVRIVAPQRVVVGATGERVSRAVDGANATHEYQADNVVDFAFAASPDFIEVERTFNPQERVTEQERESASSLHGLTANELQLEPIKTTLLIYKEKEHLADRYFECLFRAMAQFGLDYGPYPYPTLTVVDPPWGAENSGGMEYPTLIFGLSDTRVPKDAYDMWPLMVGIEELTIHEFAHQYWQSVVASNEFEEAWLDEGLASYVTGKVMARQYGPSAVYWKFNELPVRVTGWTGLKPLTRMDVVRSTARLDLRNDAILRNAWSYRDYDSYVANSYGKPELYLLQLEKMLGEETVRRAVRTYYERWRFGHPASGDFFRALEDAAGEELDPVIEELWRTPGHVDYGIESVASRPVSMARGIFDDGGGRAYRAGTPPEPPETVESEGESEPVDTAIRRTSVVIRRNGEVSIPVEIAFTFSDGEEIREMWDGAYRWKRFTFDRPGRLERVEIDPDDKLPADLDSTNDTYVRSFDSNGLFWWFGRVFAAVQHSLLNLAGGLL